MVRIVDDKIAYATNQKPSFFFRYKKDGILKQDLEYMKRESRVRADI